MMFSIFFFFSFLYEKAEQPNKSEIWFNAHQFFYLQMFWKLKRKISAQP